jgi:2-keto-3-deoxy-L-rhamnonate aldolase RhmA
MSSQPTDAPKSNRNWVIFLFVSIYLIATFLWRALTPAHEYAMRTDQVLTMALDLLVLVGLIGMKRQVPQPGQVLFWFALAAGIGVFAIRLTSDAAWWTDTSSIPYRCVRIDPPHPPFRRIPAMPTQIRENHAKRMLKNNQLVLCMGVNQLRTPNIAMIAAACGFDAVYIDLEHNPTSLETAAGVCVAALGMGITPIARVTSHDSHDATRILDSGAQGVMVPHIQNAKEAKAIVKACLYAPKGHRSAFGSGPQLGYAAIPQAEVCKIINEETVLMAMIETPEAVENAEEIAAVEGIDVLHIGASDLSTEMGIPGQYSSERMRAAFEKVAGAARRYGKQMGVGGVRQDFEFQSWLIKLGMRYLTGGSDIAYILSAGRADVKQLRELKIA